MMIKLAQFILSGFIFLLSQYSYAAVFSVEDLSASYKKELQERKLWHEQCPIPLERLKLLTLSYYDFSGQEQHDGKMIVLDAVADDVVEIFKTLHAKKFPIEKIRLTSNYAGDDELAMEDNISSSFNCRAITGGTMPSIHAYGLAVDVNVLQNPYIAFDEPGSAHILPRQGIDYLNRHNQRPGMVEPIVDIFKQHGFPIWGGRWNTPIDYQHFQPTRLVAQLLALMSSQDAKRFFKLIVARPEVMEQLTLDDFASLAKRYKEDSERFFQNFTKMLK